MCAVVQVVPEASVCVGVFCADAKATLVNDEPRTIALEL